MTADVPSLPSALADLVGVRERVLDEHMYRLPPQARWRATFRLQLFSAPGLRPDAKRRVASMPSSSGIRMSIRTTSAALRKAD